MAAVREHIVQGQSIRLPAFDPKLSQPSERFALTSVGLEPNPFGGRVGEYRYQIEGEDDLLHLIVTRVDGGPLSAEEGQQVAGFLFAGVSTALIWLKPGEFSQHFYVGHEEVVNASR